MDARVRTFRHLVEVAATIPGPFLPVDALVDTGATYSLFPRALLEELGVTAHDQAEFTLADGRTVMRELATVVARLDGHTRHIVCVVVDDGAEPLLGATTLELFGLTADPVNQRLVRATLYLLQVDPIAYAAPRVQNPCGSRLRINCNSRTLGGGVV